MLTMSIRPHGGSWKAAKPHHLRALKTYIELYVSNVEPGEMPPKGLILAPQDDGGLFIGTFFRTSEHHYTFQEDSTYTDITVQPRMVC